MRPIIFLDFDDVLCLNAPYSGRHLQRSGVEPLPLDFWSKLFNAPAKELLLIIMAERNPQVVLTTSWLRFLERMGFEQLLNKVGLAPVGAALHEHWDAPQLLQETRAAAITTWLKKHHQGEPFVVLDDHDSGTGLAKSPYFRAGKVVLCEPSVGLLPDHLPAIRRALAG